MSDEPVNECIEEKFFSKTSAIQMGYGLWVSSVYVVIGLALGFPSSGIPQMKADPNFPIKTSDEAWIASIIALVAPIGCLIGGFLMDRIGRKYTLVIGVLPLALGWLTMGFSRNSSQVIAGRVITGVGFGMGLGTPRVYITEICLPKMRGVVAVFTSLSMSIGLVLQALFGASFKWYILCFVYAALSTLIGISCFLLPETPYYVLLKSTPEHAERILCHFRAKGHDKQTEINELIEFKTSNDLRKLSLKGQLKRLGTRAACLPFWIMFGYIVFTQLSGNSIIFIWTIDFLQASYIPVAPGVAHLSMELVRMILGVISAILMYRIGRRPQALLSSSGVGIVCLVLGFFMLYYSSSPSPVPFVCYLLYVFFSTLGYYTLPFTMMYELYPLQLRGLLGGITNSVIDFIIFGVNAAFPFIRNLIGHAYIMIEFGVASCLATIFLFLCLPETKGLTLQEIEEYYNERRPTLVSQKSVILAQRSATLQSHERSVNRKSPSDDLAPPNSTDTS